MHYSFFVSMKGQTLYTWIIVKRTVEYRYTYVDILNNSPTTNTVIYVYVNVYPHA